MLYNNIMLVSYSQLIAFCALIVLCYSSPLTSVDMHVCHIKFFINPRARMKGYCSRSVCWFVSLSVPTFSLEPWLLYNYTKRGYVGMCNGRSVQQESGAALSKNSMFTVGA